MGVPTIRAVLLGVHDGALIFGSIPYYTTIIKFRVLVYKVMQYFYRQQNHNEKKILPGDLEVSFQAVLLGRQKSVIDLCRRCTKFRGPVVLCRAHGQLCLAMFRAAADKELPQLSKNATFSQAL